MTPGRGVKPGNGNVSADLIPFLDLSNQRADDAGYERRNCGLGKHE